MPEIITRVPERRWPYRDAGLDRLTKRRHYLTEIIPAGPDAAREAERRGPGC